MPKVISPKDVILDLEEGEDASMTLFPPQQQQQRLSVQNHRPQRYTLSTLPEYGMPKVISPKDVTLDLEESEDASMPLFPPQPAAAAVVSSNSPPSEILIISSSGDCFGSWAESRTSRRN